jgi:peptidoglycan/LPS O-acetylase OafA/YrhL
MAGERVSGAASNPVAQDARYRMLDAWRGLACVMIVVHHAGYALGWSEGDDSWARWLTVFLVRRMSLGVTIFFVISGYCIAASADASARRGDRPLAFMSRRLWRIYPPYWSALALFALVVATLEITGLGWLYRGSLAVVLDPPQILDWRQWLGNITLTETWRPHVWGPERNVYTGVAWSLCFEEQFYLICFLILWLIPSQLFKTLGLVTLATASVRMLAWSTGSLASIAGTFPLLWHMFAVGLAVYYRLNLAETRRARLAIDLGLVTLCFVGIVASDRETATAAGFGLLLVALRRWDERFQELAWLEPLRACGRRCYSIYLAHLPAGIVGNQLLYDLGLTTFWARALLMIPVVSIAGVASGWAFHAAVESRFLGRPPTLGRPLFSRFGTRRKLPAARLAGASPGRTTRFELTPSYPALR